MDDGFTAFWTAYPRKVAKKDAEKAWEKLAPSPPLQETIIDAIEQQMMTQQWADGFIPYPATWLRGARWEDEIRPDELVPAAYRPYGCDWCDHHPRCETPAHHAIKARMESRRDA